MDSKEQFQLIPGTKKKLGFKVPGENRFLYIGSAILGAALVTIFALNSYETKLMGQINNLNEQFLALEQKRDKGGEKNIKTIKEQIDIDTDLIRNHIYWSQGLQKIVSLLQNQISIISFSNSESITNEIAIRAYADNYTVLAKQIASFVYEDSIKDVSVSNVTPFPDGRLRFDFTLIIDENRLLKKSR